MIELQIEKQLLNIINKNHIQPYSKLDLQRITEKLEKKMKIKFTKIIKEIKIKNVKNLDIISKIFINMGKK